MTTKEAIQSMLDGKKVRRKSWHKRSYIYFSPNAILDVNGNCITLTFEGDDWEIYEDNKPKQTEILYEWLICNELNAWSISDRLRTEEEASTLFKEYDYKSWRKTGRSFEVEL